MNYYAYEELSRFNYVVEIEEIANGKVKCRIEDNLGHQFEVVMRDEEGVYILGGLENDGTRTN